MSRASLNVSDKLSEPSNTAENEQRAEKICLKLVKSHPNVWLMCTFNVQLDLGLAKLTLAISVV